jgi:hypothetical protein
MACGSGQAGAGDAGQAGALRVLSREAKEAPAGARTRRFCVALASAALLAYEGTMAHAQDIAPLQITGTEGYASMRYLSDEFVTDQPAPAGTTRSRQAQSDLREEVFFMTHGYSYHPNLLSFDLGGGPILQQQRFTDDAFDTRGNRALYNLTGRLTFLRDKPYRGSVFYDHLNPTLSVAPGQVLTQENEQYGFDFSLLAPVTPVPLNVDATRSHFQGRSAERVIDDRVDRFNFRASRAFGAFGSTQLQFQNVSQESASGSPNVPIQASSSSTQGLNVDSRFQFGANRQYDLVNLITLNRQSYALAGGFLPDRRDERFFLDLRGRHSDKLQTFGTYNYFAYTQGDIASTVNSLNTGFSYWPNKDTTATLGVHGDDTQTNQFSAHMYGIEGSARYQRSLSLGVAQGSYGARYDNRDQRQVVDHTNVIGERVMLTGTAYAVLGHQHVIAGSVAVSNNTRTQTFVENLDYTLTVIGFETRLQRIIGGNIIDGQEVLVDYGYDVGGTFAYTQFDQTFNLSWAYLNYLNVYFRYFDSAPQLTSGTPTFTLNTVHDSLYGARADIPFGWPFEFLVGGGYEYENRDETVSPFHRQAADVYLQGDEPLLRTGTVRLSARRTKVDYAFSNQDVNLTGYDLRYWSRPWYGLDVSADATYEHDTGAPIPRSRVLGSLKARWRYRKATATLDFGHTRETQGLFDRSRTLVQLLLRRDF